MTTLAITDRTGTLDETVDTQQTGLLDLMIDDLNPTTNYVGSATGHVRRTDAGARSRSILYRPPFHTYIPQGQKIARATLYVSFSSANWTVAGDISARRLLVPFVENQATWNERSTGVSWSTAGAQSDGLDRVATAMSTVNVDPVDLGSPIRRSFDVTNYVQEAYASNSNYGFILEADSGSVLLATGFSEGTNDQRPVFVIEYYPRDQVGTSFSGDASQYATAPSDAVHNPADVTIAGWFRIPTGYSTDFTARRLFEIGGWGQGIRDGFGVDFNATNGGLTARVWQAGVGATTIASPAAPIGSWFHVAITGRLTGGERNRFYLNGVQQGADLLSGGRSANAQSLAIAINNDTPSAVDSLEGSAAHFSIWNEELTATQVASLATGANPTTVNPSALTRYWPLSTTVPTESDLFNDAILSFTGSPPLILGPSVNRLPLRVSSTKYQTTQWGLSPRSTYEPLPPMSIGQTVVVILTSDLGQASLLVSDDVGNTWEEDHYWTDNGHYKAFRTVLDNVPTILTVSWTESPGINSTAYMRIFVIDGELAAPRSLYLGGFSETATLAYTSLSNNEMFLGIQSQTVNKFTRTTSVGYKSNFFDPNNAIVSRDTLGTPGSESASINWTGEGSAAWSWFGLVYEEGIPFTPPFTISVMRI